MSEPNPGRQLRAAIAEYRTAIEDALLEAVRPAVSALGKLGCKDKRHREEALVGHKAMCKRVRASEVA